MKDVEITISLNEEERKLTRGGETLSSVKHPDHVESDAPPTARFHVIDSFDIKNRNTFVLLGEVIEGKVTLDMWVQIPLNSTISWEGKVTSIDQIDWRKETYVGLGIEYEDTADRSIWTGLNVGLETIHILSA